MFTVLPILLLGCADIMEMNSVCIIHMRHPALRPLQLVLRNENVLLRMVYIWKKKLGNDRTVNIVLQFSSGFIQIFDVFFLNVPNCI